MTEDIDQIGAADPEAEARAWLVRLQSGAATELDLRNLSAWRARSARNDAAFRAAARMWSDLGAVLAERLPRVQAPRQNRAISRRAMFAGAGGLLAAGLVAAITLPRSRDGELISTRRGERRAFALAGGGRLELNTYSRALIRAAEAGDTIELLQGEALVQVANPINRPVVVEIGAALVRASQARLLASVREGEVGVHCLEGSLDFVSDEAVRVLHGGMRANLSDAGLAIEANLDGATALSWQDGVLIVRGWTLRALVDEFNRYRDGRIYVTNEAAGALRVNGNFQTERLDAAIDDVGRALDLPVRRLPGGIILIG